VYNRSSGVVESFLVTEGKKACGTTNQKFLYTEGARKCDPSPLRETNTKPFPHGDQSFRIREGGSRQGRNNVSPTIAGPKIIPCRRYHPNTSSLENLAEKEKHRERPALGMTHCSPTTMPLRVLGTNCRLWRQGLIGLNRVRLRR